MKSAKIILFSISMLFCGHNLYSNNEKDLEIANDLFSQAAAVLDNISESIKNVPQNSIPYVTRFAQSAATTITDFQKNEKEALNALTNKHYVTQNSAYTAIKNDLEIISKLINHINTVLNLSNMGSQPLSKAQVTQINTDITTIEIVKQTQQLPPHINELVNRIIQFIREIIEYAGVLPEKQQGRKILSFEEAMRRLEQPGERKRQTIDFP